MTSSSHRRAHAEDNRRWRRQSEWRAENCDALIHRLEQFEPAERLRQKGVVLRERGAAGEQQLEARGEIQDGQPSDPRTDGSGQLDAGHSTQLDACDQEPDIWFGAEQAKSLAAVAGFQHGPALGFQNPTHVCSNRRIAVYDHRKRGLVLVSHTPTAARRLPRSEAKRWAFRVWTPCAGTILDRSGIPTHDAGSGTWACALIPGRAAHPFLGLPNREAPVE